MGGILNDKERAYLKAVIEPFRERVEVIYKGNVYFENSTEEYIGICFKNEETILPHFKKGTMYKDMEINKEYSLEDLNL